MNKTELIAAIAEKSGQSLAASGAMLNAFIDVIAEKVSSEGEDVRISGFGTFSRKTSAERTARNPRTGEAVHVPAKTKTVFKVSKTFG